jgi:ribosome biogenesis protein YTM1
MDKVQVSFYSRQAEYAVQDTPILIPTRLKRSGLSEIINHLLDIQDQIPFDFIIDGKFLRQSLQSYLDSHGLSSENVLKIEFVRVSLPPQESATLNHDDWISSVKINTVIATGSFDGKLRIWDNQANVVDSMGGQDPLKCIEFLSNNLIVTGDIKNNVVGYSFSGQVLEKKFTCIGHLGAVESIAAGKNVFATGSWDKTIKIWSMETEGESLLKKGKKKQKLQEAVVKVEKGSLEGHGGTVSCMQFDPNENTLYTGSWDHSVRVWDVEQQTNVHTMNCEKIVACMDYIPESQSIVTGHEDGMIRIWDPRSKGFL